MLWRLVPTLLLVFCLSSSPRAEERDLSQRFLLVSTLRASTFEKELKQAAGAGYRVLFAPNESRGEEGVGAGLPQAFTERNQLLLEKAAGEAEKLEYLFLKARGESLRESRELLEKDMNEAATKGYKFPPRTLLGLMEQRTTGDSLSPTTYRILQGSSKRLQEEICTASRAEFGFVDLLDNAVVMEKSSRTTRDASSSASVESGRDAGCAYLVLGVRTEGALRKELAAGVASGYQVVAASSPGEIVVLMEKVASSASRHEYLILDSMRIGKLRRYIEDAARQGFRAVPRAFIKYSGTNIVLMEKGPETKGLYEYLILQTQKGSTLQKEMSQASGQGFRPVGMNDSQTLLLERPHP